MRQRETLAHTMMLLAFKKAENYKMAYIYSNEDNEFRNGLLPLIISVVEQGKGIKFCKNEPIMDFGNGNTIRFIDCKRPEKLHGLRFDAIVIDELAHDDNISNAELNAYIKDPEPPETVH
tara:strand:- start:612 stop:971 length:360 start_codon:yes stop_codon:yes gene_type:complete